MLEQWLEIRVVFLGIRIRKYGYLTTYSRTQEFAPLVYLLRNTVRTTVYVTMWLCTRHA